MGEDVACGKDAGEASGVGEGEGEAVDEGVAGDEGVALAWNPSSRDGDEESGASRMCFPRIRRGA